MLQNENRQVKASFIIRRNLFSFKEVRTVGLLPAVLDCACPSVPQHSLREQTEPVSSSLCLPEQTQLLSPLDHLQLLI